MSRIVFLCFLVVVLMVGPAACAAPAPMAQPAAGPAALKVLAVETFLTDIAQNVAGDRLKVASLVPIGVDPHGFQPAPADVKQVADSQLLIANGAGFEEFLDELLKNAGGERTVIEAAAGLTPREPLAGEAAHQEHTHGATAATPAATADAHAGHDHHEGDPHFWLDPIHVIKYTENIRDGLSQADPAGAEKYAANAAAYIAKLQELDGWITAQVQAVPAARRLLVTNHESFGYFADRYGFTVVGTVIPSASTGASPSAQEMAALIEHIKEHAAPAIFLETGANSQLAKQIGQEAGIKVVTGLFTHSTTDAKGAAPTYIDMMKYNVKAIVGALK
jgi:ABC-type Zn uptake system ZnuABC Zn-binding protein ZnuA